MTSSSIRIGWALLRDYVLRRQQAKAFRPGDPALLVFGLVALPAYFSMAHRLLGMQLANTTDRAAADMFTRIVLDGVRLHAGDFGAPTPKIGRARPRAQRGAVPHPARRPRGK